MNKYHRIAIIICGLNAGLFLIGAIITLIRGEQVDTLSFVLKSILAVAWTRLFIKQMMRCRSGTGQSRNQPRQSRNGQDQS